ncbi:MAG: hypothetical protein ABEK50_05395 [bacterium]
MQIVVDHLTRPWGLDLQVGLTAGWLSSRNEAVSVYATDYDETFFPAIENHVTVSSSPGSKLDPSAPTLCGPYPANYWPYQAGVNNYSVLMPYIPWDLYPRKKRNWLGRLPAYLSEDRKLILESLLELCYYPWYTIRKTYQRLLDRNAVEGAKDIFIYDDRLRKPVQDVYGREPTLISPVAAIGSGKTSDPDQKIVAMGPYEPLQNVKRLIDAFYLFVNLLGTQRREDWDGRNPMQMWQPGNFTLEIFGRGDGKSYLEEYAESQQLGEQIEFNDWVPSEDYDSTIGSALAVIDIPLAGDASTLVYHALAMGVPAVHTRHHRGIDTFLEDSPLSIKTSSTDTTQIAQGILEAAKVPSSQRIPNDDLKKAMDVESGAKHLKQEIIN